MYPSTIYSQVNPTENTFIDETGFFLDVIIGYLNDNVTAIETKLGVDGSAVATTIDYLLKNPLSINPGHKHTTASINFTADQNFVTAAQLSNLHSPHSDDQDLSGYALIANVLTKTNTTAFTPSADYHPATKKYVDDSLGGISSSSITTTAIPATDLTATGVKIGFVANENQAFGDVVFINANGKAQLGDADAIATASCVAMCIDATISADASGYYILLGVARKDAWNWTVGGLIYLSTTGTSGNTLSQTAPTATDDVVQIIGIATHADRIFFNPQLVQVEHT